MAAIRNKVSHPQAPDRGAEEASTPTPPPPEILADRYTPTALVRVAPSELGRLGDLEICRGFIKKHSRSFYLSSLLLPRARRHEAWALYAFCRQADDSVDGENPGDGRPSRQADPAPGLHDESALVLHRLEALKKRLELVYKGQPGQGSAQAIDRMFLAVVNRTGLPSAVPQRLLAGMEMDARGTRYATWEELLRYCFSVAGTVGLMMTYVLSHRMPKERRAEVMLRACDLGVAMQLTNIARDVGEDGRCGRVYLPDELLYRHALSADAVLTLSTQGRPAPLPLRRAVAELLCRAAKHYAAARAGIPMLPKDAWLSIGSAERIYRGIGDRLAAMGHDPLRRRAYVSTFGKLWRVGAAFLTGLLPGYGRLPARPTSGPADELLLRLCEEVGVVPKEH